jgi:hypothetical protein
VVTRLYNNRGSGVFCDSGPCRDNIREIVCRKEDNRENEDTAEYNGVQQRLENWIWELRSCTTDYNRERKVRSQLSATDSYGILVVEEELEVSL